MGTYNSINGGEDDDGSKSAQISVGQESTENGETIGCSNPISDVSGCFRDRLMHHNDQVRNHVHSNGEKCQPLCHLIR